MSRAPDPAAGRFAVIQLLRAAGVVLVLLGLAIAAGPPQTLSGVPDEVGYALLAAGLADVFVVPRVLSRRWRSPPR